MSARPDTSDDDLMDLSSRYGYPADPEAGDRLLVNGKWFVLEDIVSDPATGLDAFTFRNTSTDELTVSFQGSVDGRDFLADAVLVTSLTPAQYGAAEKYLKHVEQKNGRAVGLVCGNSLGGGLASYIAVRHPRIRAVTLNPAPVPERYAGVAAPNVRNYISANDPLYRALVAGRMRDRIIGEVVPYAGTSFHLTFLLANHMGFDVARAQTDSYDASMAVPFSLFHVDTVVKSGGFGAKVDLSLDNLLFMAAGLVLQRDDLLGVLGTELAGVEDELREYAADMNRREQVVREKLLDEAQDAYAPVRRAMGEAGDQVHRVLRAPLLSLPTPPGPLRVVWRPLCDQLTEAVDDLARGMQQLGDFAVRTAADAAWQAYRGLFVDESETLTEGLVQQSRILQQDLHLVDDKWVTFATSVRVVTDSMAQVDASLAAAIASRQCPPDALQAPVPPWPERVVGPLTEDWLKQFHQNIVDARQAVVGELTAKVAADLADQLWPLVRACDGLNAALESAETALSLAVRTVRMGVGVSSFTPVGLVAKAVGVDDDLRRFTERLERMRAEFTSYSNAIQDHVRHARNVLDRLPDLVLHARPYLHASFFSDAMIEQAYDSFLKCRNLVGRSQIAFAEVEYQLGDHDARMIDALADNAADLRNDLATTSDTLTEMVS